jgi:glycosyltransferase involved in cell wall biosynthesis
VREEVPGAVSARNEGVAPVEIDVADDGAPALTHEGARYALSAILPIKDPHPAFFGEAVASIFDQTVPDWELLIVTEAPEAERIRTMLGDWSADRRVSILVNEGVRLAGAVNTGMRHARSEFVALLLGDDRWSPDAVATMAAEIATHPGVDFFHSARRIIDDDGEPISGVHAPEADVTLSLFRTRSPVKHLLCWRRSLGLAVGGLDERSRSVGPDDFDFPWTMAEHGARFRAVDACLYLYRDHRDGPRLTTHLPRRLHERELDRIFRKHGLTGAERRRRIEEARRTYLRQCLYRSAWDERARRWLRRPPPVWRDSYR